MLSEVSSGTGKAFADAVPGSKRGWGDSSNNAWMVWAMVEIDLRRSSCRSSRCAGKGILTFASDGGPEVRGLKIPESREQSYNVAPSRSVYRGSIRGSLWMPSHC